MPMTSEPELTDLWWKNAVVYCLDVETFADTDGDGHGDLTGLIDRLGYLVDLGVTCLWLMPFHPSPHLDDGYDVTDHYGVDPRFGSLGDFAVLVRVAKACGLRVIIDLVVNHTSTRHPWFRAARRSRTSRFRDYYVWSDRKRAPRQPTVFPGEEDDVWTWDEQAGQYYLHHFYSHQPEVNLANRAVVEEIAKIMGFWLQLGVDGFRVDAVPFLIEPDSMPPELASDPHRLLRDLRRFLSRRRGDAVLLGEVNLPPKAAVEYFGREGDEMQLLLNFPVMQATYLSLARGRAGPLATALRRQPRPPDDSQWANFLRSHDEVTLDQLSDREREDVFAAFGPDEQMRIYGRGLRRRLPPMLGGDPRRIRMAYSLLLTMPGVPVLFYGEEIGMGENLEVPGRLSVRTPMQWSDDRNAGFSTAAPSRLTRPVVVGPFGPLAVNVADQQGDDDSMLSWMSKAIRLRRALPELGWGEPEVLRTDHPGILAHLCRWHDHATLAVHNFCQEAFSVRIARGQCRWEESIRDVFGSGSDEIRRVGDDLQLTVGAYGYRWLRLGESAGDTAP